MKWQSTTAAAWLMAWITGYSEATTGVAIPIVPALIQAPPTERVVVEAAAKGAQIHECGPAQNAPTRLEWIFKAPQAELFDPQGKVIGRHYAGPIWESTDGSKVTGEVKAQAPAPEPSAIPWLLIAARSTEGRGLFGQITRIQRLNTTGGKPPHTDCDASQRGQELRVPYAATYYFYVTKP